MQTERSHLREIEYAEDEANAVEDVRLAGTVETGDGVEVRVELGDQG